MLLQNLPGAAVFYCKRNIKTLLETTNYSANFHCHILTKMCQTWFLRFNVIMPLYVRLCFRLT